MSRYQHKAITEQIFRGLQGILLLTALALWLFVFPTPSIAIFLLVCAERVMVQFHGFICNLIERVLHWQHDFDTWE